MHPKLNTVRRARRSAAAIAALCLVLPTAPAAAEAAPAAPSFACGEDGKMQAVFASQHGSLRAFVQWPGEPLRTLDLAPATGEARIVWSDGVRSLTWEPGVRLTWRDSAGSQPVACSRDGGHAHHRPAPAAPDAAHQHHRGGRGI